MQFALLGDHEDGLDMARALAASGRHQLLTYSGSPAGAEGVRRLGLTARSIRDLEEVLADPAVEGVIVAGRPEERPNQLRRALQSEHHVLCVFPPDRTPDIAYEASMIQGDTKCVLLPLLPEALHPAMLRLAELVRAERGPLGQLRLVKVERSSPDAVLLEAEDAGRRPVVPGWDGLRLLGGEIAEVSAFAAGEELAVDQPLLMAGRFEQDVLFQVFMLPGQHAAGWRLTAIGAYGRAELLFPTGWPGRARLRWGDETDELREEAWEALDPWPALVDVFEAALAHHAQKMATALHASSTASLASTQSGDALLDDRNQAAALSWQTAVRSLELDDAAHRSVQRRRVSTLEYPEATEEVGFKGTMTLVGCAMLWVILLLVILSYWFPWIGWAIVPGLVLFLGMQVLRWIVPRSPHSSP